MAITYYSPGQYVLGGISAPRTGVAESFQAGVNANLGRQTTRQQMQEREQSMRIAASEEQRRQQAFEAAQAARAQAAASAAAQRAATAQLMEGLSGLTTPTGAAPAGVIAPVAPPRAGLDLPFRPNLPLSFGTAVSGGGGGGSAGGGGGDLLYETPAVSPEGLQNLQPLAPAPARSFMTPESMGIRAAQAQASGGVAGSPFAAPPNEFVLTQIDVPNVIPGVGMVNYVQYNPATGEIRGPNGQPIDPIMQDQMRESASFNYAGAIENTAAVTQDRLARARAAVDAAAATGNQAAYSRALDEFLEVQAAAQAAGLALPGAEAALRTTQPIASRGIFAEEGPGAAGLPAPVNAQVTAASGTEPASPEAAAAEAPTTAEEAAPTQETTWGGLQLSFGTPVQYSFGEFDGRGSEAYVAAPERIFQDLELTNRQRQRLQLLATYYQQTNNLQGLVGVMNQIDELGIEQRYLDGMTAIVGIQQENFAPVQSLLQQRYPRQQVEVRPYTDGTVEIFLDGQSEARLAWDDLAQSLRGVYDRGFIEQQRALATEAADRSRFVFEQETEQLLQGAREISVARDRAAVERLVLSGQIERIGETASGEVIFQTVVNGVPLQFVYRETVTRDPATGDEIPALIATPVDQALVQ